MIIVMINHACAADLQSSYDAYDYLPCIFRLARARAFIRPFGDRDRDTAAALLIVGFAPKAAG